MTHMVEICSCACCELRALRKWLCDHLAVPREQREALEGVRLAKRQGWARQSLPLTAMPSGTWILRTNNQITLRMEFGDGREPLPSCWAQGEMEVCVGSLRTWWEAEQGDLRGHTHVLEATGARWWWHP